VNSPTTADDSNTTLLELRKLVQQFVTERDWQRFHNLKNLSMSLSIEVAELMEHTQWLTTEEVESAASLDLTAIAEELSDVLSYTLAIANALEIDVSTAVRQKMVKNRAKYPIDSPRTAKGLPTD
jgi:dCTP diphosphatase